MSTTAATEIGKCRWCGMIHGPICPIVKSIEYFADGVTVKRVEFNTAQDYWMRTGAYRVEAASSHYKWFPDSNGQWEKLT